jgi:hypothetical protein
MGWLNRRRQRIALRAGTTAVGFTTVLAAAGCGTGNSFWNQTTPAPPQSLSNELTQVRDNTLQISSPVRGFKSLRILIRPSTTRSVTVDVTTANGDMTALKGKQVKVFDPSGSQVGASATTENGLPARITFTPCNSGNPNETAGLGEEYSVTINNGPYTTDTEIVRFFGWTGDGKKLSVSTSLRGKSPEVEAATCGEFTGSPEL